MPIYEFECGACKHRFEKLVRSMSASDAVTPKGSSKGPSGAACPACGSKKTRRAMSVFAAHASGSGSGSASASRGQAGGCGRCGGPGPCAFDE